eukprot:EG_transcript_835
MRLTTKGRRDSYQDPPRRDLRTIVYVSHIRPGYFQDETEIESLVRFASSNNRSLGLSGYLLVAPPFFLQRLEGPEAELKALVKGIRNDHRHDNFIVVEDRPIAEQRYINWAMRSFDLLRGADLKFEAVSFVLQSLSTCLAVARHAIHPPFFDAMLAGRDLALQDETADMLVVTVSMSPALVHVTAEGKCLVDVQFISRMVHHLRRRLCSLNPEGRGLVAVYGGAVVQVAIRRTGKSHNLENKVVRACVELAAGKADTAVGLVRIFVDSGKVQVKHLAVADDLRKGQFLYGEPMIRGVELLKNFPAGTPAVVLHDAVARKLLDEFNLEPAGTGMKAVKLPASATSPMATVVLTTPRRPVQSCEGALMALVKWCGPEREPRDRDRSASPPPAPPPGEGADSSNPSDTVCERAGHTAVEGDGADVEWMYQLDTLSRVYADALTRKRRPKVSAAKARARPGGRRDLPRPASGGSLASGGSPLLNLIYVSRMSDDQPMSSGEIMDLGAKAAKANARMNVTGFLLYTKPFFLQYLEGSPVVVKELFSRIRTDSRHTSVTVIASRIIAEGSRNFGVWDMKTVDLDCEAGQETAPLREVLRMLSRQFQQLRAWLPRLQHDIMLSSVTVSPGAHVPCQLVAFAVLPPRTAKAEALLTPLLASLVGFLSRGGELLGFLGRHLVGYAFHANLDMLLDEVADLCADFRAHVGVAVGQMLLVYSGAEPGDCDLGLYGPLFERARGLATQAARSRVPIVADPACDVPVAAVTWQPVNGVLHGTLEA